MEEWLNFIVGLICAFILGLASHSVYLHELKRHKWNLPWNHDENEEENTENTSQQQ